MKKLKKLLLFLSSFFSKKVQFYYSFFSFSLFIFLIANVFIFSQEFFDFKFLIANVFIFSQEFFDFKFLTINWSFILIIIQLFLINFGFGPLEQVALVNPFFFVNRDNKDIKSAVEKAYRKRKRKERGRNPNYYEHDPKHYPKVIKLVKKKKKKKKIVISKIKKKVAIPALEKKPVLFLPNLEKKPVFFLPNLEKKPVLFLPNLEEKPVSFLPNLKEKLVFFFNIRKNMVELNENAILHPIHSNFYGSYFVSLITGSHESPTVSFLVNIKNLKNGSHDQIWKQLLIYNKCLINRVLGFEKAFGTQFYAGCFNVGSKDVRALADISLFFFNHFEKSVGYKKSEIKFKDPKFLKELDYLFKQTRSCGLFTCAEIIHYFQSRSNYCTNSPILKKLAANHFLAVKLLVVSLFLQSLITAIFNYFRFRVLTFNQFLKLLEITSDPYYLNELLNQTVVNHPKFLKKIESLSASFINFYLKKKIFGRKKT